METTVEGKIRKQPKYWAISIAAIMATAFVLVQPIMQQSYAVTTETHTEFDKCHLRGDGTVIGEHPQPGDPITMNTVKANSIAKTVLAEKEIYICVPTQGGGNVTVDVTIFAEIYENMTSQTVIRKQTEVVTCVKDFTSGTPIGCFVTFPEADTILTGSNCVEQQLDFPQEMNTVNKGKIVKTIDAQKEIFICTLPDNITKKKVDLIIFTEIWEDLNDLGPNTADPQEGNPVIKKTVETLRCVSLITDGDPTNLRKDGRVESCIFLPPQQIFP